MRRSSCRERTHRQYPLHFPSRRLHRGHSGTGTTTSWPADTYSLTEPCHAQTIDTATVARLLPPRTRRGAASTYSANHAVIPADHRNKDTPLTEVVVPDYFVVLRDGERVLIE